MKSPSITWGGNINNNHVFDIYSDYSTTEDSVKLQMDMLTFVSDNSTRFGRYSFALLKIHGLDLVSWVASMTYFGNNVDTMCLYALSNMLGIHTCVFTQTHLWTTVDSSLHGELDDF